MSLRIFDSLRWRRSSTITRTISKRCSLYQVSYSDDEGGNKVQVYFYSEQTNLHSVWDTYIIEKWNKDYNSAADALQDMINNNPSFISQYANRLI